MVIKTIKNEGDYPGAISQLQKLLESKPPMDSEAGETIEIISILIANYEDEHFPIDLPSPIEAIKFRMDQQNLKNKDLIPYLGSLSKVSEVLNGKRKLSLKMIRALNKGLEIPAEVLLQETGKIKSLDEKRMDLKGFPLSDLV